MNKSKFLAAILFSTVFIFANSAYAADSLIKREATNLDENYQTKVTLTFNLPTAEDKAVDVVVVADTALKELGMANDVYAKVADFAHQLDTLTGSKKANIALVLYGLGSETVFGLTDAASVTGDFVTAKITEKTSWINSHSFGANVQSGVERGKAILDASTTGTAKKDRHIILLTDGSATLYNNADGVSASVVYNGGGSNLYPMSNMDSNGDVGSTSRATTSTTLFAANDEDYAETFDAMFARGSEIEAIAAKAYKYQKSQYTAEEKAEIAELIAANNVSVFTGSQVNDLEQYPFTSTEIGAYMGAKALKAAADAGYGVHTIGYLYEWGFEDDGSFCLKLIAIPSRGFVEWTGNLGDLYFHESKTVTPDQFTSDFAEIADGMFDAAPLFVIQDEIGYGTYEDGTPYNFNFVDDLDKMSITVDGVALAKTKTEDGLYGFANDDYEFILMHQEENGEAKEAIGILSQLSNLTGKVVITYYEELTPETRKTEPGEYLNLNASNRSLVYQGEQLLEELEPISVAYTVGAQSNPKTDDDIMFIVIPAVVVLGFAGIVARRELMQRR